MKNPAFMRVAAFALLAVLSACTVGPNFQHPQPPQASAFVAADEKTPTLAAQPIAADWWSYFQSAELNALVQQAVKDSPTLVSADARTVQAREAVAAASSALYPRVDAAGNVSEQRVSATQFGLPPNVFPLPPHFSLYQLSASASYTLDAFGGVRRQIEQQRAMLDHQRYERDAAYLVLTGSVVARAVDVAAIRMQLAAVDQILDLDRQNVDLVNKERNAGAVADSDVLRTQAQLAADQTLRPGLEQQLSIARHALAILVGRAPGAWSPPALELTALKLPDSLPVSVPSALVHVRPDILAAEADLHVASAAVGVATARLYPSITLTAGGGTSALTPGDLFNASGMVWSLAAGVTQPVFDAGLRRAERRAALAAFKASAADYQQTVLQAFAQVADALTALGHDTDLLAAQQRALDTASESARLQRVNYSRGGIGILDMLDAQRQNQQALLGYTRAKAQQYQDTVALIIAMGGGQAGADRTNCADGSCD